MTTHINSARTQRTATRRFVRDEKGGVTVFSLYMILLVLMVGGLALDYIQLMARRAHLQSAADSAAHAAIYTRELNSAATAKAKAMELVATALPNGRNSTAIQDGDIEFGTWDEATRVFTPDGTAKTAVRVNAIRSAERQNPVYSLLLQIIGRKSSDVTRDTVITTYRPMCFREGFVADDVVDIQSNNSYFNGFCLHSNNYISLNNNNFFQSGTVVSMPDLSTLDVPDDPYAEDSSNVGLGDALREGEWRLRIINRLPIIIDQLASGGGEFTPEFISGSAPILLSDKTLAPANFTSGRIHTHSCTGNQKLSFDGGTYSQIVFVTNCEIQFKSGVIFEDAVIATRNTDVKSFNSPASLQLGRDDNCAEGGSAVLLTLGGLDVAADMRVYGSRIIANGPIQFSANADGIQGASMISGSTISGTSNMSMAFCGTGMENIFEVDYFHIVD